MTDLEQTKIFAVVGTPNMGYEILMFLRMQLQDVAKQHPVLVVINGVDENTDRETLLKKAAEVIAAQGIPSDEEQKRMLEYMKSVEAEMALKYTAVEHVDLPRMFPKRRKRYVDIYRFQNHWSRACRYRNRVLNRQMRLLQKKDCR